MDTRKSVVQSFDPQVEHRDTVSLDGLEDLFHWASDMVADPGDPRSRRQKEQKLRRNVLELIQHAKELEAHDRVADEIAYLQRRVIALLQSVADKMEENATLKQIVVTQYIALARCAELQDEVKQLQAMTWYREEAEAERKHLLDAVSKLKKERDFLDELLTATESENTRLARMYNNVNAELGLLKNRRWWQPLVQLFRNALAVS